MLQAGKVALVLKIVFYIVIFYETQGLMPNCICTELGLQQNNCILKY
jgi:hypothetical protein